MGLGGTDFSQDLAYVSLISWALTPNVLQLSHSQSPRQLTEPTHQVRTLKGSKWHKSPMQHGRT